MAIFVGKGKGRVGMGSEDKKNNKIKLIKTNIDGMNGRVWQTQFCKWSTEQEMKTLEGEYAGRGNSTFQNTKTRKVLAFWGAQTKDLCGIWSNERGEEERVAKDAVMGVAQARLVCPRDFIRAFGLHPGYRALRSEKPINRMKFFKKIRKDRVLTLTTSGWNYFRWSCKNFTCVLKIL